MISIWILCVPFSYTLMQKMHKDIDAKYPRCKPLSPKYRKWNLLLALAGGPITLVSVTIDYIFFHRVGK